MKNVILVLLVCLIALSAFAGDKSLTIYSKANFNGQTIAAGDYKVAVDVKGTTAEVKFLKNGKAVATATGELVELKDAPKDTGILYVANADGSRTVKEIQFINQKQAIRFNADANAVGK